MAVDGGLDGALLAEVTRSLQSPDADQLNAPRADDAMVAESHQLLLETQALLASFSDAGSSNSEVACSTSPTEPPRAQTTQRDSTATPVERRRVTRKVQAPQRLVDYRRIPRSMATAGDAGSTCSTQQAPSPRVDSLGSRGGSPPRGGAAMSSTVAVGPPALSSCPQKPKKKRVRRSQVELKFLRVQVRRLEDHLKQLKLRPWLRTPIADLANISATEENGGIDQSRSLSAIWEGIAQRQVKDCMRAEQENQRLKRSLAVHTEQALDLRRKLWKGVDQEHLEAVARSQNMQPELQIAFTEDASDIFADQLAYLLRMRQDLLRGPFGPSPAVNFRWDLLPTEELVAFPPHANGDLFFETCCGTKVPFDVDVTAKAYWRMFGLGSAQRAAPASQGSSINQDVVTQKIALRLEHEGKMLRMQGHKSVRKYEDADGVTIMWAATAQAVSARGVLLHGVGMQKTGWVKLRRVGSYLDGGQQVSPLTTVEIHSKTAPLFRKDVINQDQHMPAFIKMSRKVNGILREECYQQMGTLLVEEDWNARYGGEFAVAQEGERA